MSGLDTPENASWRERARKLGREFVISATGQVRERSNKNPNRATGEPYYETQVNDLLRGSVPVHLPQGGLQLRTTEFQNDANPDMRLVGGYLFIANGRATPSALAVQSLAFEKNERFAYYCKVQFSMPVSADDPNRLDHFAAQTSDLLSHLLPYLMLRLPDWPEIESVATTEPVTNSTSTGS